MNIYISTIIYIIVADIKHITTVDIVKMVDIVKIVVKSVQNFLRVHIPSACLAFAVW